MTGFLLIAFIALSLGHAVAYKLFLSIFPIFSTQYLIYVRAVFVILTLSFGVASIISHKYDSVFSETFYKISAVWIGILLYILLASLLYGIIVLTTNALSFKIPVLLIGRILFSLALLVSAWGIYNAQNIRITRKTITIVNLPNEWRGKTAVFFSDVHLGQVNGEGFAEKISNKIKELNPDIVINGGDMFDGVAEANSSKVVSPFSNLNAPLGSYFVTGNHEYYGNFKSYEEAIQKAGFQILDNKSINIKGLNLIGVGFNSVNRREDFTSTLSNINFDPKLPSVLVKHVPFDLDVAQNAGISLQLSGHTHRAQMFPLSYLTRIVYDGYDYGLKNFGSMQVLVSDGVGTWGPPMRVGTNAEIIFITFE